MHLNYKQLTGNAGDLVIKTSRSASLPLSNIVGSGYRKSLLFFSIVAKISPSKSHTQTF